MLDQRGYTETERDDNLKVKEREKSKAGSNIFLRRVRAGLLVLRRLRAIFNGEDRYRTMERRVDSGGVLSVCPGVWSSLEFGQSHHKFNAQVT